MAGMFQRMAKGYRDYVWPFAPPLLVALANVAFFQFMPSLVFAARHIWVRRVKP